MVGTIQTEHRTAPGTQILVDQGGNPSSDRDYGCYQHIAQGETRILLVPQPSVTDINDPLRWPRWKKHLAFGNALLYAFNGAMTGPMMAGGMLQLAAFFNRPLPDIAYSNGATLISQGFGTLLWMPLAVKYGRRPVYLTSNILMCIACIWLAIAAEKAYPVFVITRTFLGLWEAPIEAIVPSTVTDLYHLHERGEKISLYGLCVLGGNELGPLVSAYIIHGLSMRWAFFIVAMLIGGSVLGMALFMPETKFTGERPVIRREMGGDEHDVGDEKGSSDHREAVEGDCSRGPPGCLHGSSPAKKNFLQELAFCSVVDREISIWRLFIRPFILMAYPTVLWVSSNTSLVHRPYNFPSGSQGLIFISPLLGSLVGTYLCGPIADRVATYFTIRNGGIREPEMRLPTCIIAALLTFLGALISGVTYHYKTHWSGPIVGFGVLSAGAQMGATLSISYVLDCHTELSAEIMVTISCLKSAVAWVWTWCINDWVDANGLLVVFLAIGAVNVVVYASVFIFHIWGKAIRIWIHEKQFLGAS
ncbi:major facilitator superfamily domain-containing protein [Aspergillus californicus]